MCLIMLYESGSVQHLSVVQLFGLSVAYQCGSMWVGCLYIFAKTNSDGNSAKLDVG